MKIRICDYRSNEGRTAFNLGYKGPNPYAAGTESARLWSKGYDERKAADNGAI